MVKQLRDYQQAAIDAIEDSWASGINRPAVVAATGAGKTLTFSELIGRHVEKLRADGKRILVLAHRETLLEQGEGAIKAQVPGIWTAVVKGSRGQRTHQFADVIIASVQTLARPKRREAIDRIGMVIVDECHLAASKSYREVLAHYGCMDGRETPTVGFTATLTRMNGGLPDVWQSVAYEKGIASLIAEGFLVPPVAKSVDVGLNLATTRVTAGDLNTGDIARAMEDSAAFDTIADVWMDKASERPTIAFLPDVKTTEKLRDAFLARGVAAESVIGATPATERRAAFERYRTGETRVLTSCMTLTEGFDAPATSCVIIGRPTLNPGLFIQMVGRGLRLSPGKEDCLILDIAGASLKHNLAGVNDLASDCLSNCGCDCLSCGCGGRCKCGIRKCGCACVEQHESAAKPCCDEGDACGCGCEGELPDGGVHCICSLNDDCACKGEGPLQETKEISAEVLRNLVEIDVLGAALAKSPFVWGTTAAGIRNLAVGQDEYVFVFPDPDSDGYFQGRIERTSRQHDGSYAPLIRMDEGALPADEARAALEDYASGTGWTYSNKKARWTRSPASEAQKGLMRRLGIPIPDGCTKGDASEALSAHKVTKCLDHRIGHYLKK